MPADLSGVLVVDDDTDIRETLRLALEDEGYSVHEAEDGVIALRTLRESPRPFVVLLDLMMPRLDGEGVLRAAASDERLHRHVYLMVTAKYQSLPASLKALITQLDVPVLPKPVDLDVLLDAVAVASGRIP